MRRAAALALLMLAGCAPRHAPTIVVPSLEAYAVAAAQASAAASGPGCTVTRVVDGDTVKARCGGGEEANLRLMGFDTPETFRSGCPAEK